MQTGTISHRKNGARFIETVRARAPRGFAEAVKRAAEANQLSTSEFVRRAIAGAIEPTTLQAKPAKNTSEHASLNSDGAAE